MYKQAIARMIILCVRPYLSIVGDTGEVVRLYVTVHCLVVEEKQAAANVTVAVSERAEVEKVKLTWQTHR